MAKEILLFTLIRFYVGSHRPVLNRQPSAEEWAATIDDACRQGVVGIAFTAVEMLPPGEMPPPRAIMEWKAMVMAIERKNTRLNTECKYLSQEFRANNTGMCVIKGQTLAPLYPHPLRRSCGDIDVWMEGGSERVRTFMMNNFRDVESSHYHSSAEIRPNVLLEAHYTPTMMFSPFADRRLQAWFREIMPEQFATQHDGINVPTPLFHLVYLPLHIFHHLMVEGVGFKQILDYYYVVKSTTPEQHQQAAEILWGLGLRKYHNVLVQAISCLDSDDDPQSNLILREVMRTGTVSTADIYARRQGYRGIVFAAMAKCQRLMRTASLSYSEAFWMLVGNVRNLLARK